MRLKVTDKKSRFRCKDKKIKDKKWKKINETFMGIYFFFSWVKSYVCKIKCIGDNDFRYTLWILEFYLEFNNKKKTKNKIGNLSKIKTFLFTIAHIVCMSHFNRIINIICQKPSVVP